MKVIYYYACTQAGNTESQVEDGFLFVDYQSTQSEYPHYGITLIAISRYTAK